MNNKDKQALYESIIQEVAQQVKRRLNEEDFPQNQQPQPQQPQLQQAQQSQQQTQQNANVSDFQRQWIQQWNGFAQDYKKFKSSVFGAFDDIQDAIAKVKKVSNEEREYIQKNIMDKLEKIENDIYELKKK